MPKKTIKTKRAGFGLEMRTFEGSKGTYIVFRLPKGAYHAFVETEAKGAAIDCGSRMSRRENRRTHCASPSARLVENQRHA